MQSRKPVGTATSAVPSSGTSVQPSRRAARAGYSAVRSGDDVKIALSTSSGAKPLASRSAESSSSVASSIASLVLAVAVVAPRSPRRIFVMALADQLRLMVITDPVLLKGRDAVAVCRAAAQGGATMIQVRWKDGSPDEVLELTRALVAALPVPVLVNDRADIALAAGAAGAHLGWDDVPLTALRRHLPPGFLLGISVRAPEGVPVIGIGGVTAANATGVIRAGAVGVAVIGAVLSAPDPEAAARALAAAAHA